MKKLPTAHRIALLSNANNICARGILTGIAIYLRSTRASWDQTSTNRLAIRTSCGRCIPSARMPARASRPNRWQTMSASHARRWNRTSGQYMQAVFKRELRCKPREYQECAAGSSIDATQAEALSR